jgi:CBS domain-containing protein
MEGNMPATAMAKQVKDVMSRDVVTIDTEGTVHDALRLMAENHVSALPIVNRRSQCVGLVSTIDLVDLARGLDEVLESHSDASDGGNWLVGQLLDEFGHENITSVMADRPTTVPPTATLVRAAQMMLQAHVHRLPVVNGSKQLVGIISTMDIVEAFANGEPG